MISYRDLLQRPNEFQPLSSHKSVFNRASSIGFTEVDITDLFHSSSNQLLLARNLHAVNGKNGGTSKFDVFESLVPKAQKEFCRRNDITAYEMAETQSTGMVDWAELLRVINNNFLKFCYNMLRWNNFNPFRSRAMVGATGSRKSKKYNEMLADDIPTLDIWADQQVERYNSQYWLGNQIPVWRTTLHTRHFDRSNGGLRNGNSDRASLEGFSLGYDMSAAKSLIGKWKADEWWGLE